MKLNKSLYGMLQSPLYLYNHLMGYFEARGFKPIPLYTCIFYGRIIIELIYIDDMLFFGTDQDNIDEVAK